ncbi:hypothetical protein D3C87_1156940 [compost metagenome]
MSLAVTSQVWLSIWSFVVSAVVGVHIQNCGLKSVGCTDAGEWNPMPRKSLTRTALPSA